MQHTAPSPALHRANTQASRPAFSVVAIHDGFFTGIRAMEALERLKFNLRPDLQVYPITLSFDMLERVEQRTTSIRAAASADLLLVSAANESPLPHHVKQWFDSVHKLQRERRPIIVALHEEDSEFNSNTGPLCTQLKAVADTWQTEFMCNEDFDQRLDCDFATQRIRSKSPASINRSKPFGGEFQAAPRFWGING
jgi:hypothetical protein